MAQLPIRATAKLTIIPYEKFENNILSGIGFPFIALYNPTTFTLSSGQEIVSKTTSKGTPGDLSFLYANNRTLKVDLFLDGTGASPPLGIPVGKAFGAVGKAISGGSVASINAQAAAQGVLSAFAVTKLVNFFFHLTGKQEAVPKPILDSDNKVISPGTHTANPLKIIWGAGLRFKCQLQNATVSYTLFNQLGQPLRATISATFLELGSNGINPFQSPDLTKVHLVKAGDTLYNIAKKEYDDESFYLQIAQANDLKNYRKLVPGQTLVLPPIAKNESE